MASRRDLESLIALKRREIEKEKTILGLSPSLEPIPTIENEEKNSTTDHPLPSAKTVNFVPKTSHPEHNGSSGIRTVRQAKNDEDTKNGAIPADLERYIRRYIGLPIMLKAGEFSPNNPLFPPSQRLHGDALWNGLGDYELRANTLRRRRQQEYRKQLDLFSPNNPLFPPSQRLHGDALWNGLGDYEHRANTLRRRRQQEYRKQLDLQAQQKREAKAREEKERREREERERESERQLLERESDYKPTHYERQPQTQSQESHNKQMRQNQHETSDAAVQVVGRGRSVAVQTDSPDIRARSPPTMTRAERELSPRTVADRPGDERPIMPAQQDARRRSYGDFDERPTRNSNRDKLVSDLRHTYMPSILDSEAIHMRNLKAEKEAVERRQFYQQELRSQIEEQQRIREERRSREKMLEIAEMRRLEQQLSVLRGARDNELASTHQRARQMKENAAEFEKKRTTLQKEIEEEQKSLFRATSQPLNVHKQRNIYTSQSEAKIPIYYPKPRERKIEDKPYSMNIPENSIFSPNYDVDKYLRKNLNPSNESLRLETDKYSPETLTREKEKRYSFAPEYEKTNDFNIVIEKAIVHQPPKNGTGDQKPKSVDQKPKYEPSFLRKDIQELIVKDKEDVPVLRHSPEVAILDSETKTKVNTDAMTKVEDKWKVPVVQKNIVRSLSNGDGNNVSILTQLGSIRRQLQMEQLRLDQMSRGDGA